LKRANEHVPDPDQCADDVEDRSLQHKETSRTVERIKNLFSRRDKRQLRFRAVLLDQESSALGIHRRVEERP